MKRQLASLKCLLVMAAIGFTPTAVCSFELITKTETVIVEEVKIDIKKTAENFIVLCDTSSSMGEFYKKTGKKKLDLEREIFKTRNAVLPELAINGGLYSFTPKALTFSTTVLKPFYEMKPYNKAEFAKAIDQLPTEASGPTLLQQGLSELDGILAKLSGHTVVFVVTDGAYSDWDHMQKPVDIAKDLARKYDVSFFVVDSSDKKKNPQLQHAVSSINARSRVISFDQFIENPLFLIGALFVLDAKSVKKSIDIEKIIGVKLGDLLFAHDSAEINDTYADGLKKLGTYMQTTPKARLAISAFTDNNGPTAYNLELSRRRAESIASYLENKYKIAPERLVLNYYGEANPVASNDTPEGRAKNRRVEGFIFGL